MPKGKRAGVSGMASVCAGGGVATLYAFGQIVVADNACPAAIANNDEFLIPVRNRQPYFDLDVGVAGWGERGGDAAECGQRLIWVGAAPSPASIRHRERARGNGLSESNLRVRQLERAQTFACGCRRAERHCAKQRRKDDESHSEYPQHSSIKICRPHPAARVRRPHPAARVQRNVQVSSKYRWGAGTQSS